MHIGLVTQPGKPFNQFGYACVPGKEIPEETWKSWMAVDVATVNNRLQNGWVAWVPVPDADDVAPSSGPDFDAMDKDALIAFAAEHLDAKLDKRSGADTLRAQVKAMAQRQTMVNEAKARLAADAARAAAANTPPALPADDPSSKAGEKGAEKTGADQT